jgi:hypothetical protein
MTQSPTDTGTLSVSYELQPHAVLFDDRCRWPVGHKFILTIAPGAECGDKKNSWEFPQCGKKAAAISDFLCGVADVRGRRFVGEPHKKRLFL